MVSDDVVFDLSNGGRVFKRGVAQEHLPSSIVPTKSVIEFLRPNTVDLGVARKTSYTCCVVPAVEHVLIAKYLTAADYGYFHYF